MGLLLAVHSLALALPITNHPITQQITEPVTMPSETTLSLHDGKHPNSATHLNIDTDTNTDTSSEADRVEHSFPSESEHEPTDSEKEGRQALRRKWALKIQQYRDEEKAAAQQEEMKKRYKDWEINEAARLERLRLSLLDGTLRSLDSTVRGTELPETERSIDIPIFEDPLSWANSEASKSADPIPRGFNIKQTAVSRRSESDDNTQRMVDPEPCSSFVVTSIGDQNTSLTKRMGLSGKQYEGK